MLYRSLKPLFRFCLLAALFSVVLCCAAAAQEQQTPIVRDEMRHDVSPPLSELIKKAPPAGGQPEAEEMLVIPHPPGFRPADEPDPVLQPPFSAGAAAPGPPVSVGPTLLLNFDGVAQCSPAFGCAPPDTEGAVGLTQYVQWVNLQFAVYKKSDGSLLAGPSLGNNLWSGFPGDCATSNDGDPIVTYDKLADRWVFTQFVLHNLAGPFSQCVAVSTTSDALGTYNRYQFGPYTDINDYPKLGVWPDAYYITYNMFSHSTLSFLGTQACAFDRTKMLSGQAATQVCFQQAPTVGGVLPSDVDGHTPPPASSPNYMVEFANDFASLNLYKFQVDFTNPSNSSFSAATKIPVAPFTPFCLQVRGCVPQQGTPNMLDSLGDRLMYRLAYRNFGDHESLVVNHSVAVTVNGVSSSGVRWYEIQSPGSTPTVAQQSTFAPDANFRWMGSIAMDQVGDIAMGYSVSSSAMFPSIAVATRLASDPPNTLQPEISVINGTGSQTNFLTRWGDYSAMQVDPVDDCTFWYTTEYLKASGSFNWNTRINSFKFPGCDKPDLSITVSHSGNYTQNQNGATFAVDVKNVGAKDTDGTLVTVTATLPIGLTATAASGTGWSCTPGTTTTCTRSDVLPANSAYPTITVTVNVAVNAQGFVTNTATVAGGGEVNPTNDTSSDVITVIQLGPDPTITKIHSGPFIQGQTGTYNITVTDVGLTDLDGTTVAVVDTLPNGLTAKAASGPGWTCTLGPPVSCTRSDVLAKGTSYPLITLTVNIAGNAPLGPAVNTATVSGGGDVNSLNNIAKDTVTIIPPPPDLSITKTHSGNFNQGQSGVSYTLTVSNAPGAGPTSGTVTVTDPLPTGLTVSGLTAGGWSCNVTSNTVTCSRNDVLAPGNSYPIIAISVVVADNAPASVTNTATVSGGGDISPGNNTASDPTTINPSPNLTIAKSHTPDPFVLGSTGTYNITVRNVGSVATVGTVTVLDVMPPGMIANAVTATGWSCPNALPNTVVSCNRSDPLNPGQSYPVIAITVGVNAGNGGPVTNTASVSGGGEFNLNDDSASDLTNVNAPVLSIAKSHAGNFTVGQNGNYTITVGNQGQLPTVGSSVNVTDTMPQGLTAIGVNATGWTCGSVPTTFLSCSRSDVLMNGASYPPIGVTVQIDPTTAIPSVKNIAGVTGGGDLSVHSAFDPTLINLPDLTITKTHNGNFFSGETGAAYTITVTNSGSVATAGGTVTVSDFVPFDMTATAAGGTGWSCSVNAFFVSCTRPAGILAPGNSYPPITLTVNVANSGFPFAVTNSVSVSGIGDANLANNNAFDVTQIVMPVSITPTSPTTVTVSAGTAATFSFTANLSTNPPVGNVNLNVALLPPNSKATFSSNTINQSGTVTLTIDTSGNGHVASLGPSRVGRWTAVFAAMFFALVALFSIKTANQRGSRRWLWAGLGASGLVLVLVFVGCGGGSHPPPPVTTPPGTFRMTITATSSNNGIPAAGVPVTVIVK